MKILIASIMFLFLLVSVEPAFSHSGGQILQDAMQVASQDDDDNGCAIAGPEETNGSIILNLFLVGLNVFSPPDS